MTGDPDLRIDGLSIWVLDRPLPDATNYYDANWLVVRASMDVDRASVTAQGSILMTSDFQQFRNELASMNEMLTGEATLSSHEPNLKVTLKAGRLGHIGGVVEITPEHLSQYHRFDVGLDQSYLPQLIANCDAILERFPVLLAPDSTE